MKCLAESKYFYKLNSLNLSINSLGDNGVQYLAESKYFHNLTSLYLNSIDFFIDANGMIILSESKYYSKLTLSLAISAIEISLFY